MSKRDRVEQFGVEKIKIGTQIFQNIPWHSQGDMARFFNKSIGTISEKLKTLKCNNKNSRLLFVTKTEGHRTVKRRITYYSFDIMAKLCIDDGDTGLIEKYQDFLRELGIVFPINIVLISDEKDATRIIKTIFENIVEIKFQYPIGKYTVDGYIPSYKIIFEIDGTHHDKKVVRAHDVCRQREITRLHPDHSFIRFSPHNCFNFCNKILQMSRPNGSRSIEQ